MNIIVVITFFEREMIQLQNLLYKQREKLYNSKFVKAMMSFTLDVRSYVGRWNFELENVFQKTMRRLKAGETLLRIYFYHLHVSRFNRILI